MQARPLTGSAARIARLEEWHFWFAGRRALLERLLRRRLPQPSLLADVGCGTGSSLLLLRSLGHRAVGFDLRSGDARADAQRLPLRPQSLDAALALDVLEHAPDDAAVLRELHAALKPGGVLIAAVPAGPWLWSFRDEAAGHLRRYTRKGLLGKARAAGFEVLEVRPYQFFLFAPLALARLLGRRGPALRDAEERIPRLLNSALTRVAVLEARLPVPFGSSLFAVLRKS